MRKIIIGLLLLLSVTASAQWQQTGSKVRYVTGIGIPTKDTAAGVSADSSQILIRPADSSLYVKYKRTWLRVGGGGGSIAGSGTTNYIPKFTSSSAIGNSQIFDNGTKVGIGYGGVGAYKFGVQYTQSSGTLDGFILNANTLTNSYAIWSANAIGGGLYGLSNPYTGFINYTDAAATSYINDGGGYFSWHNSTAELMRLTNAGNVGIGTTSPAAKLSVQGTTLINTNTDNGNDKLQVNGSASIANATFNGTVSISNSTGIPANAGGSNLFFAGGFASPVSGRVLIGDGTGWKMHFSKRLSSVTTDLVTIQDNGDITTSGTVLSTQFKLSALNTAPASSTDTGTTGEIRISGTYIYICTATNTWRRVAIGTW